MVIRWRTRFRKVLRIGRPEQIKHHDPAELGRVLAQRRAAEQPRALASLYIDGHWRAYYGRHRIGQTRISRLKRVMRAETDYWIHQAQGQPLLVVHESVDSSGGQSAVA